MRRSWHRTKYKCPCCVLRKICTASDTAIDSVCSGCVCDSSSCADSACTHDTRRCSACHVSAFSLTVFNTWIIFQRVCVLICADTYTKTLLSTQYDTENSHITGPKRARSGVWWPACDRVGFSPHGTFKISIWCLPL